jgi:ABC-type lipoprotein export system ATPase subunit
VGKMWLPPIPPNNELVELTDVTSVVIVGANGSGKSRLGAWIDERTNRTIIVHRVSAQRALMIEEFIQPRPLEQATRLLFIGSVEPSYTFQHKKGSRWHDNPIGHLLNDFDIALSWLFAEHSKTAIDYREGCKNATGTIPPVSESRLETALRIWKEVMPQRQLNVQDNKVSANLAGTNPYAGKEMSDGERVTLYLIAQCLAAPQNAIVVLDEPELHLHQAIQARLWDQIEAARTDCVFVYITHDLAFAASRVRAKKIWVRSYDGKQRWDWQEVFPTEQFPESMVLRILGSRRPILFVEGQVSSLDLAVYSALFPDRLVIPRSSCRSVIDSTTAISSLPQLHHTDAYGVIDRDHRSDAEIASYAKDRVYASDVAEIENLFLTPEAIQHASTHLKRVPAADLTAVQDFLFGELEKEIAVQVNDRATFQLQQRLNSFPGLKDHKGGAVEFQRAVEEYLTPIDPAAIHAECETLFKDILARRDYSALLRYYNRKSLASRISRNLGLADGEYPKFVLRLLQMADGDKLRCDLRSRLPPIPVAIGETS